MVGILDNGAIYGDLIIFNGIYNDKHDNPEFGSMEIFQGMNGIYW